MNQALKNCTFFYTLTIILITFMNIVYLLFPLIYIIINVILILIIKSFIKKRIEDNRMAWSYSVSISLGITFIFTVIFITQFAQDLFRF